MDPTQLTRQDTEATPVLMQRIHTYLTRLGAHATMNDDTVGWLTYDTAWTHTRAVATAEPLAAHLRDLMPLAHPGETYGAYARRLTLALRGEPGADPSVDRLEAAAHQSGAPGLVALVHILGGAR